MRRRALAPPTERLSNRRRRGGRGIGRVLAAIALLVVLVVTGFYLWLRSSLPQTTGRLAVAGLEAAVSLYRDRDGVPHIFAATMRDGYRALGVVHAQDRLFQMDFERRLGQGRLSEVAGPATLSVDRMMRTLDVAGAAERSLAGLSPEVRDALAAYADGVNSVIDQWRGAGPPEYYVLRTAPAPGGPPTR